MKNVPGNPDFVAARWRDGGRRQQRGVTLLIALIVLVAMTIAGLALVRSVDTSSLLAINLAFRQSAEASADKAMESAIGTLRGMTTIALQSDGGSGSGYVASVPSTPIDFTGNAGTGTLFDWTTGATIAADDAGNSATYVIHRLCSTAGALDASTCTTWQEQSIAADSEGVAVAGETYRDPSLTGTGTAMHGLYRITLRISGPHSTYSYVQAIVIV